MIKGIKYIYCVSDCYARALVNESKDYESFRLKCYCNLREGLSNLRYTNASEILGFIILLERIGRSDEEFYDLVDFINAVNLESNGTPIVLGLCDSTGYGELENYLDLDNISIYLVDEIDMMTDVVIRRDLFGTIVKELYSPYLDEEVKVTKEPNEPMSSNFDPLFRESILRLSEPVVVAPNLRLAMEMDPVFISIPKDDDVAYFLRSEQINKIYDNYKDRTEMLNNILQNSSEGDASIYRSIYKLIQEGRL